MHGRQLEEVLTLTAATIEPIPAEDALVELMEIGLLRSTSPFCWASASEVRTAFSPRSTPRRAGSTGDDAAGLPHATAPPEAHFGVDLQPSLSEGQIGNYLGLTVVHINRVLRSLRAERIVDLEKHSVTISIASGSRLWRGTEGQEARAQSTENADQSKQPIRLSDPEGMGVWRDVAGPIALN